MRIRRLPEAHRALRRSRGIGLALLFLSASASTGCQSGYVLRQGWGQLELSCDQVALDDPELAETLNARQSELLEWVPSVLEFARDELGLDPGNAYTSYLDLGGEPVSYVVIAAHPLALVAFEWCFPIAGCVPYKGYFDVDEAATEARRLREDGWDVEIRPVEAYSTLGWFDDPVLSSMLDRSLAGLVDLLIHETVHRTLYIPGWTELNESLATHLARDGTRRFLERFPEAFTSDELDRFLETERGREAGVELLARLRDDLDALYRSQLTDSEKTLRKRELFATASAARRWLPGATGLEAPINPSNAAILLAERYHGLLERFGELQTSLGGHPRDLLVHLRDLWENDPASLRSLFGRNDT